MLTIHVWPRRLKEFLLTHPLYKSPTSTADGHPIPGSPYLSITARPNGTLTTGP